METVLQMTCCILLTYFGLTAATDYCTWDTFAPRCGKHEVILIENATYGRMKLGKCVKTDYGHIGCHSDVTLIASKLCSGRLNCSITVPHRDMDIFNRCHLQSNELSLYLSISHSCLKVVQPNDTSCNLFTKNLEHGFIASQTTEITGCGKPNIPWTIKALPGQTISVTMHDFTPVVLGKNCKMFVTFKEKLLDKFETLCGGRGQRVHAYNTTSHELEIRLQTGTAPPKRNFLLEYKVHGCAKMKEPANGWVEHVSEKLVRMGCTDSGNIFSLTCEGHTWIGERPKCKAMIFITPAESTRFRVDTPFSVIIVVCVALILGLSILIIGICILKKKSHPYARAGPRANPAMGKDIPPPYYGTAPPSYYSARNMTPDHEYEYVSDIIQPNANVASSSVATTNTTPAHNTTGSTHMTSEMASYTGTGYGTVPQAQNAQLVITGGSSVAGNEYVSETVPFPCPKYFELDTSQPNNRMGDNTYKSLHHCAQNSKQQFGHYSQ